MLFVNIRRGKSAGIAAAFAFSLYGFLLNPQLFQQIFELPDNFFTKQRGSRLAWQERKSSLFLK